MKRIIWHWTGGRSNASDVDKKHYHFIIEGDGAVVPGDKKPEANNSTKDGDYVAHTRALNTGSIGVALAGMWGARERPFKTGDDPINEKQIKSLAELTADLCELYDVPVSRKTTLGHAEVQPTLGVRQIAKWDITWIPGMDRPGDPIEVGDILRKKVRAVQANHPEIEAPNRRHEGLKNTLAAIVEMILAMLKGMRK